MFMQGDLKRECHEAINAAQNQSSGFLKDLQMENLGRFQQIILRSPKDHLPFQSASPIYVF